MPAQIAVDARIAPLPRNVLDAARECGLDCAALAISLGLDPEALETGLNLREADRFMCAAWAALDDPGFGLYAGSVLRPERFGVVGVAAMSARTFGLAIERIARYNRLVWGDLYDLDTSGKEAIVRIAPVGPPRPYSQGRIDCELLMLLTFGRRFTGAPIAARRVTLRQPLPGYRARYAEVFDCPIEFAQADDSISFDPADLQRRLVTHNDDLGGLVIGGAEAALRRLGDEGLRAQVQLALRRMLRGDVPTLAAVAGELCMSERTLQRRLAEQDLQFSQLLDQARQEVAEEYLVERRATSDELAFLLGFATPTSFFRAFKRWTGQTPDTFRRSAMERLALGRA